MAIVITYLPPEWTFGEILQLKENIKKVTNQISLFPDLYLKSDTCKNLQKAIADKKNYLVSRVNYKKSNIEIVNFRGTKQKPK